MENLTDPTHPLTIPTESIVPPTFKPSKSSHLDESVPKAVFVPSDVPNSAPETANEKESLDTLLKMKLQLLKSMKKVHFNYQ